MAYNFIKTPPKTLLDEKPDIPDMEALLNGMAETTPQDALPSPQNAETNQSVKTPAEFSKRASAPSKGAEKSKSIPKSVKQKAVSTRDNERVNIYLSATTKKRLEMARIVTKKPTYHMILEITDAMLDHQYRCCDPGCNATFVINQENACAPKYCPICGKEKPVQIHIDRL